MHAQPVVVVGNRARVVGIPLRRLHESGHDFAAPEDVVGHEHAAGAQQIDKTIEHRRIQPFVAILKDQIEGPGHLGQQERRVAHHDVRAIGQTGARKIVARLLRSIRLDLHRDQHAARGQGAGEPDSRVPDRGPNLQDSRGTDGGGKDAKQRPDLRVDERKLRLTARLRNILEDRIRQTVEPCEILFDGFRYDGAHFRYSSLLVRHTKIIATVGPASSSDAVLDALIAAGADIFRLNFSHGTDDSHRAAFARVRAAAERAHREVAILQDLGGPKIRTGRLEGGHPLSVKAGDRLTIATGEFVGGPGRLSTTFAGLAQSVKPGDRLLLADGLVELRVDAADGSEIQTTVTEGGAIGEHKGINVPGIQLPASAITPKDADDLRFGLSLGVDMVAVSFVQTAADLQQARQLMRDANGADVPLVAKLERPEALRHLKEILESCDAVMVARGDLGLEMPLEQVPRAQKTITRGAQQHGIPVIVATQVLESMTEEPRPTRAEVNDAASAVADGVDAIMLAGETAVGRFPARAVQTLDAIIRDAELTPSFTPSPIVDLTHAADHAQALCEAAVMLANRDDAQAIVAVTRGGGTARRLSALRPRAPIFATTDRVEMARRLSLHWGVMPVCTDIGENVDAAGTLIGQELVTRGLVPAGSVVVLISISPDLTRNDANYLKIQQL